MDDDHPRKSRVLVVDDSAMVRRYIRDALERANSRCDEAFNGVEAMEKSPGGPFDLLVVDVNMPKMDGYTFLHALRGRDAEIAIDSRADDQHRGRPARHGRRLCGGRELSTW